MRNVTEVMELVLDNNKIHEALNPPDGWIDTKEQAQLRACLTEALSGHSPIDTIKIGVELITIMRDQLSNGVANVRRIAAVTARNTGMSPAEIAAASGQSVATVLRLTTESRNI